MTGKRRLTSEEKAEIERRQREAILAREPDATVHVHVADETDERGEPVVSVHWNVSRSFAWSSSGPA